MEKPTIVRTKMPHPENQEQTGVKGVMPGYCMAPSCGTGFVRGQDIVIIDEHDGMPIPLCSEQCFKDYLEWRGCMRAAMGGAP